MQPVRPGGSCPDLDNAVSGVRTFLSLMDPSLDKVGLALLPPALDSTRQGELHVQAVAGNSNRTPGGPRP